MARLNIAKRNILRKKELVAAIIHWLNIMHVVQWFFELVTSILKGIVESNSLQENIYVLNAFINRQIVHRLVYESDVTSLEQLRMTRHAFTNLCMMLENIGGLQPSKYLAIDEQVAMFLHIIAHHCKNRVIKFRFMRSGETVSRYFHNVLHAVIRLHKELLVKPEPVPENSTDERWKWFKNCLGALDGTYIRVRVPIEDRPKYRNRKGEIATNVLGVCSRDMQFIYVLPGWEGSAADGRVLRDALLRNHGLHVPNGNYYLVDAGYTNCKGFLAPFRGQCYHLSHWKEGHQPKNPKEFFNMKHSAARNVIERCFGVLKNRWAILRSPSFYSIKTQTRIIMACCLLHNFIRREMPNDPFNTISQEPQSNDQVTIEDDSSGITRIEPSDEWSTWRMNLAEQMYNEWRNRRHAN
ncbi:hypothetical protein CsatB_010356 [Cannabis sativa]